MSWKTFKELLALLWFYSVCMAVVVVVLAVTWLAMPTVFYYYEQWDNYWRVAK